MLDLFTTVSVASCTATVALKMRTKIKFHPPAKKKASYLRGRKEERYEKEKAF